MIAAAFVSSGALVSGLVAGGSFVVDSALATEDRVKSTRDLAESTGLERAQLTAYDGIAVVQARSAATTVLLRANEVLASTGHKVDASSLAAVAVSLAQYDDLPAGRTRALTASARAEITSVMAAVAVVDRAAAKLAALKAAAAKAAAAKAAAAKAAAAKAAAVKAAAAAKAAAVKAAAAKAAAVKAAADRKAAAKAAAIKAAAARASAAKAASSSSANTPAGARATARGMAASRYGWGSGQFACLSQLWQKESGWNYRAYNASSGATGIPQALPGSKMASAGSNWSTSASTQISWGLGYIKSRYGTPCSAWAHSQAVNWY
ncbi:MAG: hypothetical protein ABIX44_01615 [Cryobacterium sp.]